MLQSVMTQPGKIEFREIDKPQPQAGEVLIQVRRIGVCGSDIHVYHGKHPYTGYPVVQGHEVSGIVAEVGPGVAEFQPGDKVVFMPQVTCGKCYPCQTGQYHICDHLKVMGFQTDGAGQEYFPVAAEKVLKLPENVSLDEGAMVEPVSVAVHALRRFGSVSGAHVLVLGAGTIGSLVGQCARALGAAKVMITDISDYKVEMAKTCGFEKVVNPRKEDFAKAVVEYMGERKADVIFECVGVQDTITSAIEIARKGSTIVVVGVFGQKPVVDLGLVQDHELTLIGTLMYQKEDYLRAIELVSGGRLCLGPMITHRFPFRQYLEAYHTIESSGGNYIKVMIDL